MDGLSRETFQRCYQLLRRCEEFDELESLRVVFGSAELAPFRDRLPEGNNIRERIERAVDFLMRQRLSDGRSALVLFLAELRDRYDPQDERHPLLEELRGIVERELGSEDVPDGQPFAYVLAPHDDHESHGVVKLIMDAARAAHVTPLVDTPRGADNIKYFLKADIVVVLVVPGDPELMFSCSLAMLFARQILLLAYKRDHDQARAMLSGAKMLLCPLAPGYDDKFKQSIVDEIQRLRANPEEERLFHKALPEPLRNALRDPTRLAPAETHRAGQQQLDQIVEILAGLTRQVEQLQAGMTSNQSQQVDVLRSQLSDMIAEYRAAEVQVDKVRDALSAVVRDRDAVVQQIRVVARALESERTRISGPRNAVSQVFVPAALIVPGPPPPGSEAQRLQAERFVKAFYMDVTPVTNVEFARFVRETGYRTIYERSPEPQERTWRQPEGPGSSTEGREDHPVVWVCREDALAYAKWAGRRLPTRLEWERAMRGVAGYTWPWGEEFDLARCNLESTGTTPVAAYPTGASPAGCLDMIGNVWEWLADELPDGRLMLMGGSWAEPVQKMRVGYKQLIVCGDGADGATGFRCAMDVPEPDSR